MRAERPQCTRAVADEAGGIVGRAAVLGLAGVEMQAYAGVLDRDKVIATGLPAITPPIDCPLSHASVPTQPVATTGI